MPEFSYRASVVSEMMDSRQKHAGMTVICIEGRRHKFINLINPKP